MGMLAAWSQRRSQDGQQATTPMDLRHVVPSIPRSPSARRCERRRPPRAAERVPRRGSDIPVRRARARVAEPWRCGSETERTAAGGGDAQWTEGSEREANSLSPFTHAPCCDMAVCPASAHARPAHASRETTGRCYQRSCASIRAARCASVSKSTSAWRGLLSGLWVLAPRGQIRVVRFPLQPRSVAGRVLLTNAGVTDM